MVFPSYLRPAEQKIVSAVINKALGLGYVVSVYDGEEWALKKSADYEAITAEIAAPIAPRSTSAEPKTAPRSAGWCSSMATTRA
jgi:hypothetical protein